MTGSRQHGHSGHYRYLSGLVTRVGSHYANRAVNHLYELGKRKAGEKYDDYMKNAHQYPHKKRVVHVKDVHKKSIASKALIESTEMEAAGVAQHYFKHSHKKSKKAKLMSSLSRPIIHREITAGSFGVTPGGCDYLELSAVSRSSLQIRLNEAISQAQGTTLSATLSNTQVLMNYVEFKRTFTNQHNEPMFVMWHEWLPKKAISTSPSSLATNQGGEEQWTNVKDTAPANGVYFLDTDIQKLANVRYNYKLLHRKRLYMKPGETIVLYSRYSLNALYTFDGLSIGPGTTMVPMMTPRATFQMQGATACAVTTGGAVTSNRVRCDYIERVEYVTTPYPLSTAKLSRFDTQSALPIGAVGATKHINVDTGVVEVDAEV